ncbi:MAG: hypothetical protein IPI30_21805 [Saprospiraceae bacterium]|nr:hypothetical protein [Candidatus Vicinibacter affinis]
MVPGQQTQKRHCDLHGSPAVVPSRYLFIHPIFAGLVEAACQGSNPFPLSGAKPGGGFWTGLNVDSIGIFNPSKVAAFYFKLPGSQWLYFRQNR